MFIWTQLDVQSNFECSNLISRNQFFPSCHTMLAKLIRIRLNVQVHVIRSAINHSNLLAP